MLMTHCSVRDANTWRIANMLQYLRQFLLAPIRGVGTFKRRWAVHCVHEAPKLSNSTNTNERTHTRLTVIYVKVYMHNKIRSWGQGLIAIGAFTLRTRLHNLTTCLRNWADTSDSIS
jgi:hypothetical protein